MFYQDIIFYEDDLGDFGYCQFRLRFRVMQDCAFGLLRCYVRNDMMQIRCVDTRYFIDFKQNEYVLRDFSVRENTYEELRDKGFLFTPEFNLDDN